MKHPARYILAFTVVATTLCAGRLFASDQTASAENRVVSEKLVARFTRSFGRTVLRNPLVIQWRNVSPSTVPVIFTALDRSSSLSLSPCQFRLPPPLL